VGDVVDDKRSKSVALFDRCQFIPVGDGRTDVEVSSNLDRVSVFVEEGHESRHHDVRIKIVVGVNRPVVRSAPKCDERRHCRLWEVLLHVTLKVVRGITPFGV
jgi:hypothetical protein